MRSMAFQINDANPLTQDALHAGLSDDLLQANPDIEFTHFDTDTGDWF